MLVRSCFRLVTSIVLPTTARGVIELFTSARDSTLLGRHDVVRPLSGRGDKTPLGVASGTRPLFTLSGPFLIFPAGSYLFSCTHTHRLISVLDYLEHPPLLHSNDLYYYCSAP